MRSSRRSFASGAAEPIRRAGADLPGLDYPPGGARSTILAVNGRFIDWRLCGGALLAAGAVIAAALAMPVPLSEGVAATDPAERLPEAPFEAAPEDLGAFLEIRRWGPPPAAPEPEAVEEATPALNPILAEMGFVGLIAVQDERAVLLALPEGEIVRMLPGDTLPDGRILVSVADNSLTLAGEGGPAEVLTLFPRLPAPGPPPATPRAKRQGAEGVDEMPAPAMAGLRNERAIPILRGAPGVLPHDRVRHPADRSLSGSDPAAQV